ncbi:MAG: hypothetical protein LIP06_12865 [Tannerellaceae bacterium]|nr:hypothetical protein [Tannerellaceae bacterium]
MDSRLTLYTLFLLWILTGCESIYMMSDCKLVAHRGYWDTEGSCDNSIASLENAIALGVYGVEFDVIQSADDSLLVCHGPDYGHLEIKEASFVELRKIKLENNETPPSLREYFQACKRLPPCMLFLEVKDPESVEEILSLVNEFSFQERMVYLSFSKSACINIKTLSPTNEVFYLNGDLSPDELQELNLDGFVYSYLTLRDRHDWIKRARTLGMKSGAYPVDTKSQLKWCLSTNLTYAVTDNPVLFKKLSGQ